MKKRYYFIAGYVFVMVLLGIPAFSQIKLSDQSTPISYTADVMLVIGSVMAVLLIAALLVWRIVKFILVKLGKRPDDYFIISVDAKKTIDHWLLTTNGKYDKKNDKAEMERDKRDNQTVEW